MSDKIISLAESNNNGQVRSPEHALKDALNDVGKDGALKMGKKLIIIALDESEGDYQISWYQAGMKMSQCITLCEVAKTRFLSEMGYIE